MIRSVPPYTPAAGSSRRGFFRILGALAAAAVLGPARFLRAGPRGPAPGRQPLDAKGAMHIGPEDRCPVCGMHVARYPKFNCACQVADRRTFYFCDTVCLVRAWLNPATLLGMEPSQLQRTVVRDYFTGRQIDGQKAFYIAGSDVIGPMGPTLVPLQAKNHIDSFRKRHGGRAVLRLQDMTESVWSQVFGKGIE